MKKILLFAAATAVALSSCSKNEVAELPDSAKTVVGFGTYAGVATKATVETAFSQGDVFLVDAYFTESATFASLASAPATFMRDQTVTGAASDGTTTVADGTVPNKWVYSPIKYWPNDTNDKVSFFAFTNASSTLPATAFNAVNTTAPYTPSFTVEGATTDIMVASLLDQVESASAIEFKFVHAMAQVNFTAKLAAALASETTVNITSLVVDYGDSNKLGGGTFTFSNNYDISDNDPVIGSWSNTGSTSELSDVTVVSTSQDITSYTSSTALTLGEPILIIPTASKPTVTMRYTVFTKAGEVSANNSTVENIATFEIEPTTLNTVYNYNIVISLTGVTVDASISSFDSTEVDKTVTVKTTVAEVN